MTTGGPTQPRDMVPPHVSMPPPRYVPIPPGHFSNPMENLIAASVRLAALPVDGDDSTAVGQRASPDGPDSARDLFLQPRQDPFNSSALVSSASSKPEPELQ